MVFLPILLLFASPEEAHREALARYGHSRWLANKQQLASATQQLENAAKLDPKAVAPKRDLVRLYADLGRDAAAIRLAKEVLGTDPADAVTSQILSRLLMEAKQYAEAAMVLKKAVESPKLATEPALKLKMLRELARAKQLLKDWPAAIAAWKSVLVFLDDRKLLRDGYDTLDLHRERAAAFEKLGQACVENKMYADAIDAFNKAASIYRKEAAEPHAAARLSWNLSGVYASANEPEKALASLDEFLKLKPKAVSPYRRYADLLRQAGRDRAIEPGLDAMATAQPDNPAIRWVFAAEMARRDFTNGHFRFLQLVPTTTDETFFDLLVKTYAEQDKPHELLAIAEELFPPPVEGPKALTVPAAQSDRQQAFATAVGKEPAFAPAILKAAQSRRLLSPELCELLAWLAERADNPEAVERALRQSLRAAGNNPGTTAFERLATHYMRHRQWEELISLGATMRIPGFEPYKAILVSNALAELGRGDEALKMLNTQHVANFAIRRQTAVVLNILGRHAEMLATLDKMLGEFHDKHDQRRIRTLRAEAFLALDRFADMETELRNLLDDDPDDALALNNLGYNLADRNRKLPEAEALIRQAIEVDRRDRAKAGEPRLDNGVYLDSLGWVLFRQGKLADARKLLEQAVDFPEARPDAIVWDHLGDVCFRLGDKPAAKKAWQNADERYVGDHRGQQGGRASEVKKKLKLVE